MFLSTTIFYRISSDNKKPASFYGCGFAGLYRTVSDFGLAEEQGFEPWVEFPPQRFSRPSRSAAPALLLTTPLIPIYYELFKKIRSRFERAWSFAPPHEIWIFLTICILAKQRYDRTQCQSPLRNNAYHSFHFFPTPYPSQRGLKRVPFMTWQ